MSVAEYRLLRYSSGPQSTLGLILSMPARMGASFKCYTLEDEYRAVKVPGETRIPAGRYEIKIRAAGGMHNKYTKRFPWHRGMLWLQDVPGFEWIYIHIGNFDTHTEGCILVGDGVETNTKDTAGQVLKSTISYKHLAEEIYAHIDEGRQVFITVEDLA